MFQLYTAWLIVGAVALSVGVSPSNIDPARKFNWAENIGWLNWQHNTPNPGDGAHVGGSFLGGFVWAENVGWINLGDTTPANGIQYANANGTDFGVNIDPVSGDLFGLAWGENVGWINFDTASAGANRARFNQCQHRFFGYAWGENIGWLNLGHAVRHIAVGPCDVADLNCDGAVTLNDFSGFVSWFTGPGNKVNCPALEADTDGDIDLREFAVIQRNIEASP